MLVLRVRFRVRVTVRVGVKDAQGTKCLGTKKLRYEASGSLAKQGSRPDVRYSGVDPSTNPTVRLWSESGLQLGLELNEW